MNGNNQWELSGRCDICRRKDYCSRPCKKRRHLEEAYKRRQMDNLFGVLANKMLRPNKVNDQVFEMLGKSVKTNSMDENMFDALGDTAILKGV